MKSLRAYKLFRVRKDGTLGSLFINRRARLPVWRWLKAESHPTKGYALRPKWHATKFPIAPHLSMKGRSWFEVELKGIEEFERPVNQGGTWYLANSIKIISPYSTYLDENWIRLGRLNTYYQHHGAFPERMSVEEFEKRK